MDIEKLAIEAGMRLRLPDLMTFVATIEHLEAFAKAYARATLQTKPVGHVVETPNMYGAVLEQGLKHNTLLFTRPNEPTVPVEKYNKLLDVLKLLDLEALTYINHYQVGRNLYDIVQQAIAEAEGKEG